MSWGVYFNTTAGMIPIWELEATEPPQRLIVVWNALKRTWGQPDAKLIYILASVVRQHCPDFLHIGGIGCADIDNNIAYVVESDAGETETINTMVHEFRHFVDGLHPWKGEVGHPLKEEK